MILYPGVILPFLLLLMDSCTRGETNKKKNVPTEGCSGFFSNSYIQKYKNLSDPRYAFVASYFARRASGIEKGGLRCDDRRTSSAHISEYYIPILLVSLSLSLFRKRLCHIAHCTIAPSSLLPLTRPMA